MSTGSDDEFSDSACRNSNGRTKACARRRVPSSKNTEGQIQGLAGQVNMLLNDGPGVSVTITASLNKEVVREYRCSSVEDVSAWQEDEIERVLALVKDGTKITALSYGFQDTSDSDMS